METFFNTNFLSFSAYRCRFIPRLVAMVRYLLALPTVLYVLEDGVTGALR